jgi:hypothetical protein
VKFTKNLSLVRINESGCFERVNLSKIVKMEKRKAFLNSSFFKEFRKPARIRFLDINFTNPIIYKDGIKCSEETCNITAYSRGEFLEVEVSGFSAYEVREGAYCGDGFCNGNENCSICFIDCGACEKKEAEQEKEIEESEELIEKPAKGLLENETTEKEQRTEIKNRTINLEEKAIQKTKIKEIIFYSIVVIMVLLIIMLIFYFIRLKKPKS